MRCEEINNQIELFAAGGCEKLVRQEINEHISKCPQCSVELGKARRFVSWFDEKIKHIDVSTIQSHKPKRILLRVFSAAAVILVAICIYFIVTPANKSFEVTLLNGGYIKATEGSTVHRIGESNYRLIKGKVFIKTRKERLTILTDTANVEVVNIDDDGVGVLEVSIDNKGGENMNSLITIIAVFCGTVQVTSPTTPSNSVTLKAGDTILVEQGKTLQKPQDKTKDISFVDIFNGKNPRLPESAKEVIKECLVIKSEKDLEPMLQHAYMINDSDRKRAQKIDFNKEMVVIVAVSCPGGNCKEPPPVVKVKIIKILEEEGKVLVHWNKTREKSELCTNNRDHTHGPEYVYHVVTCKKTEKPFQFVEQNEMDNEVKELLKKLDDYDLDEREKATKKLIELGKKDKEFVGSKVQVHLKNAESAEAKERCKKILDGLTAKTEQPKEDCGCKYAKEPWHKSCDVCKNCFLNGCKNRPPR